MEKNANKRCVARDIIKTIISQDRGRGKDEERETPLDGLTAVMTTTTTTPTKKVLSAHDNGHDDDDDGEITTSIRYNTAESALTHVRTDGKTIGI